MQSSYLSSHADIRVFGEHLVWWAPAFARLLSHESKGGYFDAVAIFLAALITADRALLGVEPTNRTVAPSQVDRPDECEGCLLGS
jgi:TorA maturation chaperone TorD